MRTEAGECVGLTELTPSQWLPAAENPDLSAVFAANGIAPSSATAAIEQAAGDYTRRVQIAEQEFTARRDLAQTDVNIEMCRRQLELRLLIEANNAGPLE